jgi:hypothetical protein
MAEMHQSNDVDTNMFDNIATSPSVEKPVKGDSKESLMLKLTHPPSDVANFIGLPTDDVRSQLLFQWVNQDLKVTSRVLTTGSATQIINNPQDIVYLITNGNRVNAIPFIRVGNKYLQDIPNTLINRLINHETWNSNITLHRPIYKSSTISLNATAFNDTGMVASCQFNPTIIFSGPLGRLFTDNRNMGISYIKHCIKQDPTIISNGQELDDDHFNDRWGYHLPKYVKDDLFEALRLPKTTTIRIDPDCLTQIACFGTTGDLFDQVPDQGQILTQSTRSYGAKAKEGAFVVQRLNTPAPAWLPGNTSQIKNGLYKCVTCGIAPDGGYQFNNLVEMTTDVLANDLYDTAWTKDMTWAWVSFNGLTYNAQALPANNQSIIIYKTYLGVEAQPSLQSAYTGLPKVSPRPNIKVIEDYLSSLYDQKDCLPDRFNFLGTLLKAGSSLIMKNFPKIASSFIGELGGMESSKDKKEGKEATDLGGIAAMLTKLVVDKKGDKKTSKMADKIWDKGAEKALHNHKSAEKKEVKKIVKAEKKAVKRLTDKRPTPRKLKKQ